MRKITFEVNEETYLRIMKAANSAGFESTDAYVQSLVTEEDELDISFEEMRFPKTIVESVLKAKDEAIRNGWVEESTVRANVDREFGKWQGKSAG